MLSTFYRQRNPARKTLNHFNPFPQKHLLSTYRILAIVKAWASDTEPKRPLKPMFKPTTGAGLRS